MLPEEETWSVTLERESRRVKDKEVVDLQPGLSDQEKKAELRKAARAQWDLAEWHYARGDYDTAEKEYLRYINEFPYMDLDYGYRTDDARNRLNEIRAFRAREQQGTYPGP